MLCVKPTADRALETKILSTLTVKGKEPRLITALENEETLGYIAVDPIGTTLHLIGFSLTNCTDYTTLSKNQREITDYLIRTAGNYAFNRGLLTLQNEQKEFDNLYRQFRFTQVDDKLSVHLNVLFKKCESCGG